MLSRRIVKSASMAVLSTFSILSLAGIASAEEVKYSYTVDSRNTASIKTQTTTYDNASASAEVVSTYEEAQNKTVESTGNRISPTSFESSHVSQTNQTPENSFRLNEQQLSQSQDRQYPTVVQANSSEGQNREYYADKNIDEVVLNTTISDVARSVIPTSAIAQKIIDNNSYEQYYSSELAFAFTSPIPTATPASPDLPVAPQNPVGLLQQLSLVLSQSPFVGFLGNLFDSSQRLTPILTLLVIPLGFCLMVLVPNLFIVYLRKSGLSGASRGAPRGALYPFDTPLKMSFITVPLRR